MNRALVKFSLRGRELPKNADDGSAGYGGGAGLPAWKLVSVGGEQWRQRAVQSAPRVHNPGGWVGLPLVERVWGFVFVKKHPASCVDISQACAVGMHVIRTDCGA